MQRTYDEKREFIRMKVDTGVTLTPLNGSDKRYSALCKDLSGSGMLLEMTETLELGIEVKVEITSGQNPFLATGEVARIKPTADGKFIIGLKLNEIHP